MQELPPGFVIDGQPQQSAPSNTIITKRANPAEQRGTDLRNQMTEVQIAKMLDDMRSGEKPQIVKADDGSVVQVFPDGTTRTVVPGNPNGSPTGDKSGVTAKIRSDALQAFNDANALRRSAKELRDRYASGPGATSGISSLYDYLPTETNQGFDEASQRARGYVKRSLGFTGGEGNTVAESSSLYDPYLPSTWDKDGNILGKITALEGLAADAERKAIATLGGVPDQFGNITQPQQGQVPQQPQQNDQAVAGNVPQQGRDRSNQAAVLFGGPGQDGGGGGFVPYGSTMKTEANPQWKGVNQAVKGMIVAGRSPDEIKAFLNSKGIAGDAARGVDDAINYFRKTGRDNFGVDVEKIEVPMSGFEQFRNNAPQTSIGTALATAGNAGGFGIPQALAGGEGLDYLRQQNPTSAFAGDVAGVIGGTAALGRAGGAVAGRVAPSLLGGGAKAAAGRQLATDAAYGGIYGGATDGDPLTGAATAAVGSGLGMGIGKGIQKGLTGVTDPAVQYLTQRGIPLTIGQTLGNRGVIGKTMNKLESLPIVGDMMGARRLDGLKAFEQAALNDVVAPVGGNIGRGGAEGLADAQGIVSDAYGRALDGVNIPGDAQFVSDAGAALQKGKGIPTMGQQFDYGINQNIAPLFDGGQLSGREFQAATQNLRKMGSDFNREGAMGNFAANAVGEVDSALQGLVGRQAPDVLPRFNAANDAFRNLAPFEQARIGAINQEAITPAQLSRAITTGTKNFGGRASAARGDRLTELVKYGQEVLPSTVPNSGTADRGLAALFLPAALGGGAAYSGIQDNPGTAGLLATLAAMSTKTGQKALQKALTSRPSSVRKAGGLFGSRKAQRAIGGAITAPLLIE